MEPMTLGSPSGSPSPATYLPSFLMGDSQITPTTPRNNTLSPEKGRGLSFAATSPGFAGTPLHQNESSNRSMVGQRTLFGAYSGNNSSSLYPGTPLQSNHLNNTGVNTTATGPPTQDLFDSLRNERNQVQTPIRSIDLTSSSNTQSPVHQFGSHPVQSHQNASFLCMNPTTGVSKQSTLLQQSDNYLTSSPTNISRITSPLNMGTMPGRVMGSTDANSTPNASLLPYSFTENQALSHINRFWVTVFGFPASSSSNVLYHFAQCGTIVDKVFAPQNGNWVHIKYSSRLECDKALNYNEKIIMNNIMIGVSHCKDPNITDKENMPCAETGSTQNTPKLRSLANTSYLAAQSDIAVASSPRLATKNTSLLHKAVDLLFG